MSRIYLSPPDIQAGDYDALRAVLDSNWVAPVGPQLEAFEKALAGQTGMPHALAVSSGTAALHLALRVLGVGPGDVVLCPSFTFAASANPIRYCGAEPVFVDSEAASWNMDPGLLEAALEAHPSVKAVIVVHLYGQCADMDAIRPLCRQRGLPIIEDAAEALGASYRGEPAGSMGDLAFFSFNGNKIITTSGGGLLLGRDPRLMARARHLATQAREPARHYEHREVGYNYRMSNLLAGLGLSQLGDLPRRIAARRVHYEAYEAAFADSGTVEMMPRVDPGAANYWLSCLTFRDPGGQALRDRVIACLEAADIEARPLWKPMHLQPVFKDCSCFGGAVSADLFVRGLCLPSGSALSPSQREQVIAAVLEQLP